MTKLSSVGFETRPFTSTDEPRVLDLLRASLGGGPAGERTAEYFRWKHLRSPFGASALFVAEADGDIVGLRAFMRWRFRTKDGDLDAVRAVDTATDPAFRGRGVFTQLHRYGLEALRGQARLVFNTPNDQSLPGNLKMGASVVGGVPVWIRVRRALSFAGSIRSRALHVSPNRPRPEVNAPRVAEALDHEEAVSVLLEGIELDRRITTARSIDYLRWRYEHAHGLDYRAVWEGGASRIRGLAIFRVRPRGRLWESTISELIAPPDEPGVARRLMRNVIRCAAVDHLTCSFTPGSAALRTARRLGFIRSPQTMTFVVNPLQNVGPDPTRLESWALSLGDLEVF
jgi:GNAT superfamily N-acetyltransferase